jgi:hypothetical protein
MGEVEAAETGEEAEGRHGVVEPVPLLQLFGLGEIGNKVLRGYNIYQVSRLSNG